MLKEHEILLVNNVLNEVLHGLPETIRVKSLLRQKDELNRFWDAWEANSTLPVAAQYGPLIISCIETVIHELGDEDFETRIGVGLAEAKLFVRRLGSVAGSN